MLAVCGGEFSVGGWIWLVVAEAGGGFLANNFFLKGENPDFDTDIEFVHIICYFI